MLQLIVLIFGLVLAAPSRAGQAAQDLSQADAQTLAALANQAGSDQSLRSSATTAMQALIQFGDSDLKGAVTSAYKAYGGFKNSENLDRVHKQGLLAKVSMGAPGTWNLTDKETAFLGSPTSYRRVDPSFLGSGESSKIAEEFEKKTGIKRQEFLDMLAAVSENKIYVSDPKLAEKVDAQFDGIVEKIPNPEFRAKVLSALSLVPSLSRHKLLVEAVQNMVQVAKNFAPASASDISVQPNGTTGKVAAAGTEPNRDPAAAEQGATKEPPKDEALQHLAESLTSDAMARAGEDELGSHKLDGVIKAAIHDDPENETIFEKVSRRYRMLTPEMVPAHAEKTPRT